MVTGGRLYGGDGWTVMDGRRRSGHGDLRGGGMVAYKSGVVCGKETAQMCDKVEHQVRIPTHTHTGCAQRKSWLLFMQPL